MRKPIVLLVAVALLVGGAPASPALAQRLTPSGHPSRGIVTFPEGRLDGTALADLRLEGVAVQVLEVLPMAIVEGPPDRITSFVKSQPGLEFYPEERLEFASSESNHAIGASALHDLGLTGKGIQIALVDSGVDATHPDLRDRVVHNVRMVGPEYAGQPSGTPPGSIVIPVDEGPFSNTDVGGHGTLVAGVLAADGTTHPSHLGVAPDADLISYSVGVAANFMTTSIAAYDHILATPEWGVDVVNSSWGSSAFELFDPGHPINIATKTLNERGIATVWSASNGGAEETEATLNPYAVAPWNISVAATDVHGQRYTRSSNGLMSDNSEPTAAVDGHLSFTGDRLGMYHPTVAAPGEAIETTCVPGQYAICGTERKGVASGTSLAAPHVTGLVALLKQARPEVTGGELRAILEASAKSTPSNSPFWQVGYGSVDARAALDLIQHNNFSQKLKKAHEDAEERVLATREWQVPSSEFWTWSPALGASQTADQRSLEFSVADEADALKVTVAFFANGGITDHRVTVFDAEGNEVGATVPTAFPGVSTLLLDLREVPSAPGEWTLRVDGRLPLTNDSFEPGQVTVQAALLEAQPPEVALPDRFVADDVLPLAFAPDPARATGLTTPEGCQVEPGAPVGFLGGISPGGTCHGGQTGFATYLVAPAEFTSAPIERDLLLGGTVPLVVYIDDPLRPAAAPLGGRFEYDLDALSPDGKIISLARGVAPFTEAGGRYEVAFEMVPGSIDAGSRFRFRLLYPGGYSSGARMLYGGERFSEAGIVLNVGHLERAQ